MITRQKITSERSRRHKSTKKSLEKVTQDHLKKAITFERIKVFFCYARRVFKKLMSKERQRVSLPADQSDAKYKNVCVHSDMDDEYIYIIIRTNLYVVVC